VKEFLVADFTYSKEERNSYGINHAYELNQQTGKFTEIVPPGGNNALATGINDNGDVVGFLTASNGSVVSFLLKGHHPEPSLWTTLLADLSTTSRKSPATKVLNGGTEPTTNKAEKGASTIAEQIQQLATMDITRY
jgi:hypothetical protein